MIFTTYYNFTWFFDCSGEVSPNLCFDRLLLLKVYIKFRLKKVWRKYVSCYQRVVQNLKKNLFFVSKMTRIWWILIRALKRLKNLHFDWSLLCKVYNVWPEQVQKSYISWRWRVMQNFKKTDLWFGKWHEDLPNFHQNTWKCQMWCFHGILLPKVENAWTTNLQRSSK